MRFAKNSILTPCCLFMLMAVAAISGHALDAASVLEAMPPDTAADAESLFNRIFEEPDALLFDLCGRITAPSLGPTDARAEFVLFGLAKHVALPEMQSQRVRLTRVFELALGRAEHAEVQRFFMGLLRFCGDNTTLRVLESYACDPVVYGFAVQTLAAIGGVVGVSAQLQHPCHEVPDRDASIRSALLHFSTQPAYSADETGLSGELIAALVSPEVVPDVQRAAALCREALGAATLKPHHEAMVLRGLAHFAGADALPDLMRSLASPHRVVRGMVLMLLSDLEGEYVSQSVVGKLPEFEETMRPQVIAMLGGRRDAVAQRAVREALSDALIEVRLAAYGAVNRESDDAFLPLLMDAMERADSEREVQAVKSALLRLPDLEEKLREALPRRKTALAELSPSQKAAYLELIAERQALWLSTEAERLFEDSDARVRRTAYATIGALAAPVYIEKLYERLLAEERDAEADAARNAIVALAKRNAEEAAEARQQEKDREAQGLPPVPHHSSASSKKDAVGQAEALLADADAQGAARLIRTLGALGTEEALTVVRNVSEQWLFTEPDETVSTALFETLGRSESPEAGVILVTLWQRLEDESLRLEALKNYIASVQRNYSEPAKQGELLAGIQEQCRSEAEQQAVADAIKKAQREAEKR